MLIFMIWGSRQNLCIFMSKSRAQRVHIVRTHVFLKVPGRICAYLGPDSEKSCVSKGPRQNLYTFTSKCRPPNGQVAQVARVVQVVQLYRNGCVTDATQESAHTYIQTSIPQQFAKHINYYVHVCMCAYVCNGVHYTGMAPRHCHTMPCHAIDVLTKWYRALWCYQQPCGQYSDKCQILLYLLRSMVPPQCRHLELGC